MLHGKKDEVVPISFSKKVLKIFNKAEKKLFIIKKVIIVYLIFIPLNFMKKQLSKICLLMFLNPCL